MCAEYGIKEFALLLSIREVIYLWYETLLWGEGNSY